MTVWWRRSSRTQCLCVATRGTMWNWTRSGFNVAPLGCGCLVGHGDLTRQIYNVLSEYVGADDDGEGGRQTFNLESGRMIRGRRGC